MIEIPEAVSLAKQLYGALAGRRIKRVVAGLSPHKFAWFHGDPAGYDALLGGRTVDQAVSHGGMVEVKAGNASLLFSDGVVFRFHREKEPRPAKHQLLVEFEDGAALSCSVQMYGGLVCFQDGDYDNQYYQAAKEKPSPLSKGFDRAYFTKLLSEPGADKLSAKALLATEQRIPGLGNGVLQDILYQAGIHPKRKLSSLIGPDRDRLFDSVRGVLAEMTSQGGRDTETDLFGSKGGYRTRLSKNTVGKACPACGSAIEKMAYMGGSVYVCPGCQPL
ncbi:MAG: endonuclease VIII [Firmicutes bacterium]|nr:endonuclease VIII [Bacillota bacterium]